MGSISESSQTYPIPDEVSLPPDFNKFSKELPPSCAFTDPFMEDLAPSNDPLPLSVPVINLSDPNSLELIKLACEDWGIFQITNHGVPRQLMAELEAETRKFFSLPLEQKIRALRPPDGSPGYGVAQVSPSFYPKKFWNESFIMSGSPRQHALQIWPSDTDLHAQTQFCAVMEEYQETLKGLAERMLDLMLSSLGLSSEELEWVKPKDREEPCGPPKTVLHLNSYPVCPDPTNAVGLPAHRDSSILTILHQNVLGLQAQFKGQWAPVHPIDGALIVLVGDFLQIFSNGRFKSLFHRAVVNNSIHRYSSAYFYLPPPTLTISPSEKLITADHPRLYRAVSWKEYLQIRGSNLTGALDALRLDPPAMSE